MESFWEKFVAAIKEAWHNVETWAEDEWRLFVTDFKPFLDKLATGQYAIVRDLIVTAAKQAEAGDRAGILQAVLMQAETEELAWVKDLGGDFLIVLIAVITGANPPTPAAGVQVTAADPAAVPASE